MEGVVRWHLVVVVCMLGRTRSIRRERVVGSGGTVMVFLVRRGSDEGVNHLGRV